MRKILLFYLLFFVSAIVQAQIAQVVSVERLPIASGDIRVAQMQENGDFILLTSNSLSGLVKYDLNTKQMQVLTDANGAGYCPKLSANGDYVICNENIVDAHHNRLKSQVKYQLSDKQVKRKVLSAPAKQVNTNPLNEPIAVSIKDKLILIEQNGEKKTLAPNGVDNSYIWPSISPNGKKLCYFVCGNGCWVADIDGSNPQYIGYDCKAARWLDDNTLVAMDDKDNGKIMVASQVNLYTLDGKKQSISNPKHIATYPYCSGDGKKIVYSTDNGEVYLVTLK